MNYNKMNKLYTFCSILTILFVFAALPSGAQKHVVERYRLLEGGTHLRVEFTLEDPQFIVGTMSHTRDLAFSPHLQMTPFNCEIDSTRRYLPPGSL